MSERIQFIVAEDDFVISLFLETILSEAGYEVLTTVNTGEEAIRQGASLQPQCVLMDIGLSGQMNGIDAALELKRQHKIPVIFLTGNSDILKQDPRMQDIQPLATLIKPIDDHRFIKEIQKIFPFAKTQ